MNRRLVVMRHASARTHGDSDHARELTRRGTVEAAEVAGRLVEEDLCPDHAVVSSATRARQTWHRLAERCGGCEAEVSDGLYAASSEVALEVLRLVPPEAGTVIFVGHNPTVSRLAAELAGHTGDPDALAHIIGGVPPAAAAVFSVDGAWSDLGAESARLVQVLLAGPNT